MNNKNARCSTPVYEHKNIQLDFTLSEIRKDRIAVQRGLQLESSVIAPLSKKQSKQSHDAKNIDKKNLRTSKKIIPFEDLDSDLTEYETAVDSSPKIPPAQGSGEQSVLNTSENDTSSPSSAELFSSPADHSSDKYLQRYLNTLRVDTTVSSMPVIHDFPILQLTCEDPKKLKFYSGPHADGNKEVSASEISFSPKWVHRVPSKYESLSDISSRSNTSSKLSEVVGKRESTKEIVHSKYSHLCVRNQQYKRLLSPTRKLDASEKENIFEWYGDGLEAGDANKSKKGRRKSEHEFYNTGEIAISTLRHSKLAIKKRTGNVTKNCTINSGGQSEDTFEENSESVGIPARNLLKNKATVSKRSKPKILSIEILEKPLNINFQ